MLSIYSFGHYYGKTFQIWLEVIYVMNKQVLQLEHGKFSLTLRQTTLQIKRTDRQTDMRAHREVSHSKPKLVPWETPHLSARGSDSMS